jgi:formate dehydrogenase accessory protein FdhD
VPLNNVAFKECFLALSGRLSADMVLKAAKVGIPIIASIAAALDSGIEIAKRANLTLIGFVRGKRMNVYNAPERILLS